MFYNMEYRKAVGEGSKDGMKRWISKKQMREILRAYSIRNTEFEPIEGVEYFYRSKYIKGYTILFSKEEYSGNAVIVSHTDSSGRRTFLDYWQKHSDGTFQFRFRNLWNQPFSDVEYIKELELRNKKLEDEGQKLKNMLKTANETIEKLKSKISFMK